MHRTTPTPSGTTAHAPDARRGRARRRGDARHAFSRSAGDRGRLLADAMSLNALFSSLTGVTLLAGAWLLDDWLQVAAPILAVLGGALLGFATALLWLLATPVRLRGGGRLVVAADVAWVVGASALIATPGAIAPTARVALAVVTAVVAVLATAQVIGLRRIGAGPVTGASPIAITAERVIDADAARVWAAVADAGGYARYADGIAETEIVSGHGEGMVRRCTDDRGDRWRETCTLWDEGRRYRMSVDVDTYPLHYRALLHALAMTWELAPAPGGTRARLRFDGQVKLGIVGRLAMRAMAGDRIDGILDAYERDLVGTDDDSGAPVA